MYFYPFSFFGVSFIFFYSPLAQFYEEMNSPSRKRRMISPSLRKHPEYNISTTSSSGNSNGSNNSSITPATSHNVMSKWAKIRSELDPEVENLKESIHKLAGILNDEIQGQYSELEACEVNVAALKRLALQV